MGKIIIAVFLLLSFGCNSIQEPTQTKEEIVKQVSDSLAKLQADKDSLKAQQEAASKQEVENNKIKQEKECSSKISELNDILSQSNRRRVCDEKSITGIFQNANTYNYDQPEQLVIPYDDILETRMVYGYDKRSPSIHILALGKWRLLVAYSYLFANTSMNDNEKKEYEQNNKIETDKQVQKIHVLLKTIIKCKCNRNV
ncbi:hypothetical protein CJD36_002525 [Flavipsychrobacter stenotrophus]|uniref:Lipoprotein n=1 Tax=Flavipsychrobacter stenotrophus TaxID=2077091 RepID=A0A2S7T1A6_9BACT|nr:hypothetical protein [Flavipsychrobacter stenotrophus]PQJ12637.1 hypothetical protein CJD36_002525 [Flavipsychrobacter stenotrophus]